MRACHRDKVSSNSAVEFFTTAWEKLRESIRAISPPSSNEKTGKAV